MLSRSRKAFTLLELIVVIVILGILAALAIPTFAKVIEKSRVSAAKSSAESIGRNAVALAAFDDASPLDDVNGTEAGDDTYLDLAVDAEENVDATVAGSVVTVNGYNVTLTFTGSKAEATAVAKATP